MTHHSPLTADHSPTVVLKVGGSLLDLPDLGVRIERLLAMRPGSRPVFLCGGGRLVDEIRVWHRTHRLGERDSHALSMAALDVTALLLAKLLPASRLCADPEAVAEAWRRAERPVVSPAAWWGPAALGRGSPCLPESWEVTSDSLAAVVSQELDADELFLLKSVPCPPTPDAEAAADQGVVDRHFPRVSATLNVISWVDLRTVEVDVRVVHWLGTAVDSRSLRGEPTGTELVAGSCR